MTWYRMSLSSDSSRLYISVALMINFKIAERQTTAYVDSKFWRQISNK
jgi:hypothetical protein